MRTEFVEPILPDENRDVFLRKDRTTVHIFKTSYGSYNFVSETDASQLWATWVKPVKSRRHTYSERTAKSWIRELLKEGYSLMTKELKVL